MLNRLLFSKAMGDQDGGPIRPLGDRDLRYTLADCLCVMRQADPSLYRKASRGELEYADAMGFLRLGEWSGIRDGFSQSIESCWKVTAIGGLEHLADDDRKRLVRQGFPNGCGHLLVAVCAHIDQVAQ